MSESAGNILELLVDRVEMELKEIQCGRNVTRDLTQETVSSPTESRSSISGTSGLDNFFSCRICYDSHRDVQIVFPCKCKGSIGAIHLTCLEQWLEESNRSSCELCGHEFQVERTLRYRVAESIAIWLCLKQPRPRNLNMRNLHSDLLRCVIVTPLTIACSYACIVAADFYSQNNYDHFPPARWTTYSLLAIMSLMIFSFFVWTYTAVQHHHKVWYFWWQKSSRVKVTLSSHVIGDIGDNASNQDTQSRIIDKYTSETIF